MSASYGYTGKILRVDLTTGKIWTDDTAKCKDYIGGEESATRSCGIKFPQARNPMPPENRISFRAEPICGSGVPCSGRTTITSLLPTSAHNGVGSSHMGGYFSVEMKYAGYDMIVVQGNSAKPVWLRIEVYKVKIEDAR